MNEKTTQWIHTALFKHFEQKLKVEADLPFIIEGVDRRVGHSEEQDLIELRVDGPVYTQHGRSSFTAEVFVNVLVKVLMSETDAYKMLRYLGTVVASFVDTPVRQWDVNGQPLIGCLMLQKSGRGSDRVRVNNYGQIDPAVRLQQGVVEGTYKIELED
jgi:hypothetical protein